MESSRQEKKIVKIVKSKSKKEQIRALRNNIEALLFHFIVLHHVKISLQLLVLVVLVMIIKVMLVKMVNVVHKVQLLSINKNVIKLVGVIIVIMFKQIDFLQKMVVVVNMVQLLN